MQFLIDENLPKLIGSVFEDFGFEISFVRNIENLRGQTDEVIFKYASLNKNIIVTRDVNFVNPFRFNLKELPGIILIRFPNEISVKGMCAEIMKLLKPFKKKHWHNIIILEPGSARLRKLF